MACRLSSRPKEKAGRSTRSELRSSCQFRAEFRSETDPATIVFGDYRLELITGISRLKVMNGVTGEDIKRIVTESTSQFVWIAQVV